jgi:ribonuclease HI
MDFWTVVNDGTPKQKERKGKMNIQLKCLQINLQHARLATDNLLKITQEEGIDILCIQEPYTVGNKVAGLPKSLAIYTAGAGRTRAAIVINNKQIDTIKINQLSDEDTVVIEIKFDNATLLIASMYFDINRPIEYDLQKMQAILIHAKGVGAIFAIDSNARSTSWHDVLNNKRGKVMEEFLISKQLHIANEESDHKTFQNSRGASNIDLTILNNQAIGLIQGWTIHNQDSCSDHNIIKYSLGNANAKIQLTGNNKGGVRYRVEQKDIAKFQENLVQTMGQLLSGSSKERGGIEELDEHLSQRVAVAECMETVIEELQEALEIACRNSFKRRNISQRATSHKSVPWWTQNLTILRKKVNAQRRKFQRTKGDNDLREHRKEQYLATKTEYTATIRKERYTSWKEYCTMTSITNPWSGIYRILAGRDKRSAPQTTLKQEDGTLTTNFQETIQHILQSLTPEDNEEDDTEMQKNTRALVQENIDTEDDKDFTAQEVRNVVMSMGNKKAPGEDGIPCEVFKSTVEILPRYMTAIYNGCLRKGTFPQRWKTALMIPITKPGKTESEEASKFRPISLLNTGGKVLEKLLINRINHHVYTKGYMNENQFGFRPQKSTIDAAMVVKEFVQESLAAGEVIALVSLDVQGAFDAAWWPAILKEMRDCKSPNNLYKLTKNYFTKRTTILATNSIRMEKELSRGCAQGSCSAPGYWCLQYNSLLKIKYMERTKVVAYADDLIMATRGESIRAVENYTNVELSKIQRWAKNNKIKFNDTKSKVMLVSRRKRKENKNITVYLNNKPLEQVTQIKYLGIILDQKFKFHEHITYTAEKCKKLIHSLSKAAKLTWGITHKAMAIIYRGAILPLLAYGAPLWIEAMRFEHNRQKLIRVQRLINIRMAKAFRTTSSEALCMLTGMTPIILKLEEEAAHYKIKQKSGQRDMEWDCDVEIQNWPHPAEVGTINEVAGNEDTPIQVYTDGSKQQQGVGSGAVLFKGSEMIDKIQFKLDNKCSNNQAEQLAILKALEKLEVLNKQGINALETTIYTDSRVTLDLLQNYNKHGFLVEKIRKKVATMQRSGWQIRFSWVKAHIGVHGNELADKAAKEAAQGNDTLYEYTRIPKSYLYHEAAEEAKQKWQAEWTTTNKASATKQYFPSVQDRLSIKITLTTKLAAVLTGHGKTRAYLHRFKLRDDARCICGHEEQTMDHILFRCEKTSIQREALKRKTKQQMNWPECKQELISKHTKAFCEFIESIDFEHLQQN